jgi:hypothetical protein
MTPNDYRHIFATILPPSVEDKPICGADLPRECEGRGKPDCPACTVARDALLQLGAKKMAEAIIKLAKGTS